MIDLKVFIHCFNNDEAVLMISHECFCDDSNMTWQLVPLNVPVIEGVVDKHFVVLRCIREVRPAEAGRMVVLLLHYLENCIVLLSLVGLV